MLQRCLKRYDEIRRSPHFRVKFPSSLLEKNPPQKHVNCFISCSLCGVSCRAPFSDDVRDKVTDDVGGVRVEPADVQHAAIVRVDRAEAVGRHATDNQLRKQAGFLFDFTKKKKKLINLFNF